MGGKSGGSQVTGHRYYASVVKFIGFRIEGIFAVNFDKRGWIWANPRFKTIGSRIDVNAPNLYGETEGGVKGVIEAHLGEPDQKPNLHYQAHDPLISGFPYKSYLVFRGAEDAVVEEQVSGVGGLITKLKAKLGRHSFYHGNTNHMKDCLLWPKRTRVQNTGDQQWYMMRDDGAIVCEINAVLPSNQQSNQSQVVAVREKVETRTNHGFESGLVVVNSTEKTNELNSAHLFYAAGMSYVGGSNDDKRVISNYRIEFDGEYEISGYLDFSVLGDFDFSISANVLSMDVFDDAAATPPKKDVRVFFSDRADGVSVEIVAHSVTIGESSSAWLDSHAFMYRLHPIYDNIGMLGYDINPIHKIREIITNPYPWGMGRDEDEINDDNFKVAADRIWDEGLGISWAIKDKDCIEAIEELCHHIDAGVRINRNTGKHEVVLFRGDWDDEDSYQISESQIKDMQVEITSADELINHLDVSFYDRDNIKDGSFSISENGLIKTTGQVNAQDLEFPYFQHMRNAEIVAQWKLKNLSTAKWKGTFTTGSRDARKFQKYGVIELPWSRKWQGKIKARILNINLGDGVDNTVSIEFEEIVPKSGAMTGSVVADQQQNIGALPPQPNISAVFELPYYFWVMLLGQKDADDQLNYDETTGIAAAIAVKPQNNSLYAIMMTHSGIEGEEWGRAASVYYSPAAITKQPVVLTDKQIYVEDALAFAELKVGTLIYMRGAFTESAGEWLSFESADLENNVITVKRGLLDTMPRFIDHGMYLIACDTSIATDQSYYIESDHVLVSVLTTTPSGVQKLLGSAPIEMQSRAIRPYPPANVKFNGNYWIETHVVSNDLVLTWSHRNRLQQTASSHVDWYDGSVTVEDGVTYSLELSTAQDGVIHTANNINADTYTIDADVFIPNKAHRLKLWSVRDDFDSYTVFEHNFFAEAVSLILTASVTENSASGNTVPTANISVDVDTSLKANMQFDGSGIKGKALPNSTITIEIED